MSPEIDRWLLGASLVLTVYFGSLLVLLPDSRPIRGAWQGKAESTRPFRILSSATGEWTTEKAARVGAGDFIRTADGTPTRLLLKGGAVTLAPNTLVELVRGSGAALEVRVHEGQARPSSPAVQVQQAMPQILPLPLPRR